MARKSKRKSSAPSAPRATTDRDKAVEALLALLAEQREDAVAAAQAYKRAAEV